MAKSNAERQREYRQRAAAALRNWKSLSDFSQDAAKPLPNTAQPAPTAEPSRNAEPTPSPLPNAEPSRNAPLSLPAALMQQYIAAIEDEGNVEPDERRQWIDAVPGQVADSVLLALSDLNMRLLSAGDAFVDELSPALADLLGGRDYIRAAYTWSLAMHEHRKSRKKDKGPEPVPPEVPASPLPNAEPAERKRVPLTHIYEPRRGFEADARSYPPAPGGMVRLRMTKRIRAGKPADVWEWIGDDDRRRVAAARSEGVQDVEAVIYPAAT